MVAWLFDLKIQSDKNIGKKRKKCRKSYLCEKPCLTKPIVCATIYKPHIVGFEAVPKFAHAYL